MKVDVLDRKDTVDVFNNIELNLCNFSDINIFPFFSLITELKYWKGRERGVSINTSMRKRYFDKRKILREIEEEDKGNDDLNYTERTIV